MTQMHRTGDFIDVLTTRTLSMDGTCLDAIVCDRNVVSYRQGHKTPSKRSLFQVE